LGGGAPREGGMNFLQQENRRPIEKPFVLIPAAVRNQARVSLEKRKCAFMERIAKEKRPEPKESP